MSSDKIGAALVRLLNRRGFGATCFVDGEPAVAISSPSKRENGYSIEFCYHRDSGSDYIGPFPTLLEALERACEEQDADDEQR